MKVTNFVKNMWGRALPNALTPSKFVINFSTGSSLWTLDIPTSQLDLVAKAFQEFLISKGIDCELKEHLQETEK